MNYSRATTITGDGPQSGWDFHLSHIEHDVDRMEDLYTVALWKPEAIEPAHQFDTYRYGYGWTVLNAALTADDKHADARMQAALDWWTQEHSTTAYQIHRTLVAIDETTWATRAEIAQRLNLDSNGLEPNTPHGDGLAAADRHGLVTWRNLRGPHPYAALTPAGYDLVHHDDQTLADAAQTRLRAALAAEQSGAPTTPTRPAAGKAFPTVERLAGRSPLGDAHVPVMADASQRRVRPAR